MIPALALLLAVSAPPAKPDLDGDWVVDVSDLLIMLNAWGICPESCVSDLNGDGMVDGADLLVLLEHWGQLLGHHNLHLVKDLLSQSEEQQIAIVAFGDSRSTWQNNRLHGAVFRHWDVQWAALHMEGNMGNNGRLDGLGTVLYSQPGTSQGVAPPGTTLSGSGIENRWPARIAEQWVTGEPVNPQIGVSAGWFSTSGGLMDGNPPLNEFKRGDPAQGRNIASIEFFHLGNDEPKWLPFRCEAGYNATPSGALPLITFAPATGPTSEHVINTRVLPGADPLSTGQQVYWRQRHSIDPGTGDHGHAWIGSRLNFEHGKGCILACIAEGGWSSSDHLPPDVYGIGDNTDWKYSDAKFREWYSVVIRAGCALVRIEVGANMNTLGGKFGEWNGYHSGNFQNHIMLIAERAIANLAAVGVTEVVVMLVVPWQSADDSKHKLAALRTDLWELAHQNGWAYYDQQGALLKSGSTTATGALRRIYRADAGHQNFLGMNLLGNLEWEAISRSSAPHGAGVDD